jgi:heme-degrading monooxygenase HmoA
MPFVSITRLRIRGNEQLVAFGAVMPVVFAQASDAPGRLAMDLLAESNNTFWTKTVWTDRAAMRAYMTSGSHGAVMPELSEWCDEAHVAHWEQDTEDLPTWDEAYRRLMSDGRSSAVAHPSSDHGPRTLAPPVVPI